METRRRSKQIDFMKGILVIQMIVAHCIQFFGIEQGGFKLILELVNLITFPAFVFAFGYVSDQAYYHKSYSMVWKKMLRTILRTLLAFYLSSVSYRILVKKEILNLSLMKEITLLRNFAGWSEFLISFALILIVGMVCFKLFQKINGVSLLLSLLISLLVCWVPYGKVENSILALMIGSTNYITFPVIQFMLYYVLGVFISKSDKKHGVRVFGFLGMFSIVFFLYLIKHQSFPNRFPPDWRYVLGPLIFVYLYYITACFIEQKIQVKSFKGIFHSISDSIFKNIMKVGSNTLFYLVVSNLIIFSFAGVGCMFKSNMRAMILSFFILEVIHFLISLIKHSNDLGGHNEKL